MEVKDIVAVVTGIIGCVTGVTALVRGILLDRKLHWEIYFEKKWDQIGAKIRENAESINSWLELLEKNLSHKDSKILSVESPGTLSFNDIHWTHARHLHKQLGVYSQALERCKNRVKRHNRLLFLLDENTYRDLSLKGALIGSGKVKVSDQNRQAQNAKRKKTLDLIKYYAGNSDISLEDLRANKKLAADIEQLREKIKRSINALKGLLAPIESAVDYYDKRFLK